MRRFLVTLVICLSAPPMVHSQQLEMESLRALYGYDDEQPLDLQKTLVYERDGVSVYDITYASPVEGSVTGYLVVPDGEGPFAGVLFGHWGPGNRTEFLPEAELYAKAGAVSLMIDYPWVRPAPWRKNLLLFGAAEEDLKLYNQAVVDLRRGIDLLEACSGVDADRIAYVGHSFGAQWGAVLSAVDDRIKAAVLMGGVPDLASAFLENDDPTMVALRENTAEEVYKDYLEVNAVIDAVHYVPHAAPTPLLFQFARYEKFFNEAAMKRYYEAASEPKAVRWYHTGHDLNDVQALLDRSKWLQDKIGIGSIAPILEMKLNRMN